MCEMNRQQCTVLQLFLYPVLVLFSVLLLHRIVILHDIFKPPGYGRILWCDTERGHGIIVCGLEIITTNDTHHMYHMCYAW